MAGRERPRGRAASLRGVGPPGSRGAIPFRELGRSQRTLKLIYSVPVTEPARAAGAPCRGRGRRSQPTPLRPGEAEGKRQPARQRVEPLAAAARSAATDEAAPETRGTGNGDRVLQAQQLQAQLLPAPLRAPPPQRDSTALPHSRGGRSSNRNSTAVPPSPFPTPAALSPCRRRRRRARRRHFVRCLPQRSRESSLAARGAGACARPGGGCGECACAGAP